MNGSYARDVRQRCTSLYEIDYFAGQTFLGFSVRSYLVAMGESAVCDLPPWLSTERPKSSAGSYVKVYTLREGGDEAAAPVIHSSELCCTSLST